MTEELLNELIKIISDFKIIDLFCGIASITMIVMLLGLGIYETHLNKKKKKWIQEYKATLTDEQLKAINQYKELNK